MKKWLELYGVAWTNGDSEAIVLLFSNDCRYYETPFDPPMVGKSAVRQYWAEGARDSQEDVTFNFSAIDMKNMTGFAQWQATFKRKPGSAFVKLDGVLSAKFNEENLCTEFREWWHRQESNE